MPYEGRVYENLGQLPLVSSPERLNGHVSLRFFFIFWSLDTLTLFVCNILIFVGRIKNDLIRRVSLKRLLRKDDVPVHSYYFGNDRITEVIHCKLRLEISDLKGDLVRRHLADNPACQCGYEYENSKHYLFDCPLFNNARSVSIEKISNVNYTLDCLLFGSQNLTFVENSEIFQHVSSYIILSKRFV